MSQRWALACPFASDAFLTRTNMDGRARCQRDGKVFLDAKRPFCFFLFLRSSVINYREGEPGTCILLIISAFFFYFPQTVFGSPRLFSVGVRFCYSLAWRILVRTLHSQDSPINTVGTRRQPGLTQRSLVAAPHCFSLVQWKHNNTLYYGARLFELLLILVDTWP